MQVYVMRLLFERWSRAVLPIAAAGLLLGSAQAKITYSPPANAQVYLIDGKTYYGGEIYLASHADTAGLSELGFQYLEFHGRSVGTVRYGALWPTDADLSQLPKAVSGLNYEEIAPPSYSNTDLTEADDPLMMAIKANQKSGNALIRKPNESRDSQKRYVLSKDGKLIPLETVAFDGDVLFRKSNTRATRRSDAPGLPDDLSMHGTFFTTPSDARSIRKVGEVGWRHPDLTTTFHTNPVEGGPFHTPHNVPGMRDTDLTGTFMFEPVEKGPFRKIENVTTRDSKTCGNFTVTPYSTLRNTGIGSTNWYKKESGTGTFIGGIPNYQPRDSWRGVGYRSFPTCYPSQYRGSIRTPDSRRGYR